MMGRDYLWQLAGEHYDFSFGYMGHGFEYVDSIVASWYSSGLINHPYPFHNDIFEGVRGNEFPGLYIVVRHPVCDRSDFLDEVCG